MDKLQGYLKAIASDTIAAISRGFYYHGNERVELTRRMNSAVSASRYYPQDEVVAHLIQMLYVQKDFSRSAEQAGFETTTEVRNETTNEGLYRMTAEGLEHVFVLNFASAKKPGGGFLNGKQAQEECISRTSTLYPSLLACNDFYVDNAAYGNELNLDAQIYSPGVLFIKDDFGNYIQPVEACVLTSPAPNLAKLDLEVPPNENEALRVLLRNRIYVILRAAHENGHENLLLGAWGCGVFRNDPVMIADLFEEVLWTQFANCFRRVVFSVYDNREGLPVYSPFNYVFGEPDLEEPNDLDIFSS